eukprot:gene892-1728_t
MGSGASSVPNEYLNLPPERQTEFRTKFEALTSKALPHLRDDIEKNAITTLTNLYLNEQVNSNSTLNIELPLLEDTINTVLRCGNKTPLIVDNSEGDSVNTYYSYRNAILLDGKKMGLDKSLKKIPITEIMEEARKKLVAAIKLGVPLVIAMTASVTDFAQTFTDEAACNLLENPLDLENNTKMYFPLDVFKNAGNGLLADEKMDKLFRNNEKDHGVAVSRNAAGFHIILTSRFDPEDFEEYLFGNDYGLPKPKEQYQIIIIDNNHQKPISVQSLNTHSSLETDISSHSISSESNIRNEELSPTTVNSNKITTSTSEEAKQYKNVTNTTSISSEVKQPKPFAVKNVASKTKTKTKTTTTTVTTKPPPSSSSLSTVVPKDDITLNTPPRRNIGKTTGKKK